MMNNKEKGSDLNNQYDLDTNSSQDFFQQKQPGESKIRFFLRQMLVKKSVDHMLAQVEHENSLTPGAATLKRNLNAYHILTLGLGNIIGSGIYIYSGLIAAENAGPAVILCFLIASIVAGFSALCYSELASMIPVAGSAYTYTYATMGEFPAWMVGWTLILEYLISVAAIAGGWSGYLTKFIEDAFYYKLPSKFTEAFVRWDEAEGAFQLTGNYVNIPAMAIVTFLSIMLILGTQESANVTAVACMIKVGVIIVFVIGASPDVTLARFMPFLPAAHSDYYGHFGLLGMLKGTSIAFFCYAGFDSVSTMAQESKNPKRDMPIGILGSLLISTILYLAVCVVLVGSVPYNLLEGVPQPISVAVGILGKRWLGIIVGASAVIGMITSITSGMLGQARIFYCMGSDGLLPKIFTRVHPRFKTPYVSQIMVWLITSFIAGILPVDVLGEISGVGTLATFFLVCLSVMILRLRHPELPRSFKVPFGPYLIPLLGATSSFALVLFSSPTTIMRLVIWLALGILIYFSYGYWNSNILRPRISKS